MQFYFLITRELNRETLRDNILTQHNMNSHVEAVQYYVLQSSGLLKEFWIKFARFPELQDTIKSINIYDKQKEANGDIVLDKTVSHTPASNFEAA
jgi:hypothetical protein